VTALTSGIICRRSGSNGLGSARAAALARAVAVPEQHRAGERLQLPLDLLVVASPCPRPRLDAEVRLEAVVRQKWPGGCGTAQLPCVLKEHNGERQSHRVSARPSGRPTAEMFRQESALCQVNSLDAVHSVYKVLTSQYRQLNKITSRSTTELAQSSDLAAAPACASACASSAGLVALLNLVSTWLG